MEEEAVQINLRCKGRDEDALSTRATQLLDAARRAVINSPENEGKGTDLAKLFRVAIRKTDEERKYLVGPFNTGVRRINDRFKLILGPLEEGKVITDKKLLDYKLECQKKLDAEEAKKREAEDKARKKAEAKRKKDGFVDESAPVEQEVFDNIPVKREPTRSNFGTSSIRKDWVYEVTDIAALAQAMPGLVSENAVEINKLITAGEREIIGLRIYQKERLSVR